MLYDTEQSVWYWRLTGQMERVEAFERMTCTVCDKRCGCSAR